jgi:hypothetical protein
MDTNELIELARAKADELAQMSRTTTEPRLSRSSSGGLSASSIANDRHDTSEPKQLVHSEVQTDWEFEFESSSDSDGSAASQMAPRRRPLLVEERTSLADSFQAAPSLTGRKAFESVASKSFQGLNISALSRSGIIAVDIVDQQTKQRRAGARPRPRIRVEAEDDLRELLEEERDGDPGELDFNIADGSDVDL